jgi:hypothetical protein
VDKLPRRADSFVVIRMPRRASNKLGRRQPNRRRCEASSFILIRNASSSGGAFLEELDELPFREPSPLSSGRTEP